MVNFLYKPNLSDFVSRWLFTYWASERLCGRDMTIEVPIKAFHVIKAFETRQRSLEISLTLYTRRTFTDKQCDTLSSSRTECCLPVIVTEDVVLVVGRVFADGPADEAGRAVLVVVLLDRGHVGVLLD